MWRDGGEVCVSGSRVALVRVSRVRRRIAPDSDFIEAVGVAVLAGALPTASLEAVVAAGRRTSASVAALPDVTLAGVSVAVVLARTQLMAMGGRRFVSLPRDRQADLAARLAARPFPLVGRLLQLVRSIALVAYFESPAR